MKKVIILNVIILSIHSCYSYTQNLTKDYTLTNKDFNWTLAYEGGSANNRFIEVDNGQILTAEFSFDLNKTINPICIDSYGKIINSTQIEMKKEYLSILDYASIVDEENGIKNYRKCIIPIRDSTALRSAVLEYYKSAPRGADVWSSLYVTNHTGKTIKLEFSHNPATDGYISVHDIVQYNASSFVVLFWYYKRFGDSNVQIGFLDLKKYLEE